MAESKETDGALLRNWLEGRQETAFQTLVVRYAGLALMTSRRSCGGDEWLAAEASQLTFILLAQKAPSLLGCASLGGWIHRAALMHSRNLMRSRHREQRKREHWLDSAEELPAGDATSAAAWQEMQPVLDAALAALPEKDREAVLLRFYRALGLREVGDILGISADAAQKRIERAMAKLRDYLGRRGCRELGGGTAILTTALAVGMAADAQAAPISIVAGIMAAQATATTATATTSTGLAGLLTKSTALAAGMKTSTLVLTPLLALLVAGFWFASQRSSLARLEADRDALLGKLAKASTLSGSSARTRGLPPSPLDRRPIDWAALAAELVKSGGPNGLGLHLSPVIHLQEQIRSMSRERLLECMAEAETSGIPPDQQSVVLDALYESLGEKDPRAALDRSVAKDGWENARLRVLGDWARRDPAGAEAWVDQQSPAGARPTATKAETRLFYALLEDHPEAAERRVSAMEPDTRPLLFEIENSEYDIGRVADEDQGDFARILRKYFTTEDRLAQLSYPVSEDEDLIGDGNTLSYPELEAYFERIAVQPDEFAACMEAVASHGRYQRATGYFGDSSVADVEALRAWTAARAPEIAGQVVGTALLQLKRDQAAADYALQRHAAGDGDAVLLPLLEYPGDWSKEVLRKMVKQLTDAKKRSEWWEGLELEEK